MSNNELNFSVQLQLLADGFNRGVNQANQNFGSFESQMQRYMKSMNQNTDQAQKGFDKLFGTSGDELISEFGKLTAELNGMGEGARLSEVDIQRAFGQMQNHVAGLETGLTDARAELTRLQNSNITPDDIIRAQTEINQFENNLTDARSELIRLQNTNATPEDIQRAQAEVSQLETNVIEANRELIRLQNARVTPEDIERAKAQINSLESNITAARTELTRLQNTNATPEDIQRAQTEVNQFEADIEAARAELVRLENATVTPEDILRAQNEIRNLEEELNRSVQASQDFGRAASDAMNRATNSSQNAQRAIYGLLNIQSGAQLQGQIDRINTELTEFGNLTGRTGDEWERVSREAAAEIRRLQNEIQGATDETRELGNAAERETKKFSGGVAGVRNAFGSLQGILAAAGLGIGISEIIETSDAFKTLEARVRLATGEGANFVSGFEGVSQIANNTFSSIESTGELFSRISVAAKEMGLAQTEVLSVTQTINEAIKLSGGSAASADAAITQLIQGLQSGVVRGEEFNSIMEQAPRLAQAMADGLGVTRGELRGLAQDGKLTSEVVINAVREQGEVIGKEFATLPVTVGDSIQVMKNKMFEFVGEMDKSVNQSSRLAEAITYVSDNLDSIDPATMEAINEVFDQILTVIGELFSTVGDLYSTFSDLTSMFDSTGSNVGFLTKRIQELAVGLGIMSDGLKGISILADSVFGTVTYLAAGVVAAFAAMKGQTSDLADEMFAKADELHARSEQKMLDFESSSAQAWAKMGKTSTDRLNESAAALEATYDSMVAKGSASTGALEEQFIKVSEAKIAANDNIISDDIRYELSQKNLQAVISETGEVAISAIDRAQAGYLGLGESFAEVALKAQETGISITESLATAVPKAQTVAAVDDIVTSLTVLSSQGKITNEELAAGINLTTAQYAKVEEQIKVNMAKFGEYASKVIAENDGIITAELQHAASLENLAIQMDETGSIIVTELDKATVASTRTKEQIDALAGSVGIGLSTEYLKARGSIDELTDGFDDLTDAGYDAGKALVSSLSSVTEKAANTAELDNVIELWKELGKEGKLTGQDLAEGLDLANERLAALTEGVNTVNEAYKVLGLTTRAEAAKQAETYQQAYGLILNDGMATAGQLETAFEKTAKASIAANGDVVSSFVKSQAAARGLSVTVDETGRVIFTKMGESKEAVGRIRPVVDSVSRSFGTLADASDVAGNQMVTNAQRVEQAYSKLQSKIEQVKKQQALDNADETLRNLRQYGKEERPVEGNQFGTKTAVENFLKSAGLSAGQAMEETRKLYSKQGGGSGALNFGELQGFKDGQALTNSDLAKFKTGSVFLLELAEKIRYQQKSKPPGPSLDSYANNQAPSNDYSNYNPTPQAPSRTVKLDLSYNGRSAPMSVDGNNANSLNDILNQIERDKVLSGLN